MTPRPDSAEVRFVLGELLEEERVALEEKYLADDEFFQKLREIETDLVDAYVSGEMTPAEGQRFETALERFPARREKVAFARALQRMLARPAMRNLPVWRQMLPLAAAVLLFTAGAAWFAFESLRLRNDRSSLEAQRASLAQNVTRLTKQVDEQSARVAELAAQLEKQRETAMLTIRPVKGAESGLRVASFVLAAGMLRGGSGLNAFKVPREADAIALETNLVSDGYQSYRAAIQKPSGETIVTQQGLRPRKVESGMQVSVLLSPGDLSPGDYILVLSGEKAGRAETVEELAFRVLRNR